MDNSNRHSLPKGSAANSGNRFRNGLAVVAAAVLLTWVFWGPLWEGAGFIGGDLYSYYFPQKVNLSDALARGEIPLWNTGVSLGYPQLAESQTGSLYLPSLLAYRLFDVNAAYNAIHIAHYIAAYLCTWLLARRYQLGQVGSHLAALTFVYGWFPSRACLEWAIIGGAYFPLILWCVESWLQSRRIRWLIVASVALGSFLTAGHFHMAFITLFVSSMLVVFRLFWATQLVQPELLSRRWKPLVNWGVTVGLGFLLAGPQLLPSAELKLLSQRNEASFNPVYGYIPTWYLTQPFFPFLWYGPDMDPDQALFKTALGDPPRSTNKVEAHLYFGMVPFYLMLSGLLLIRQGSLVLDRRLLMWLVIGGIGILLATGYPILWLRGMPGFSYFAGPGRYGVLAACAVGLIAGKVLETWLSRPSFRRWSPVIVILVLAATTIDLWFVSRWVTYAIMVKQPPVNDRDRSEFASLLKDETRPVRVLAPGANLPSQTGINCVPEYLGLSPKQYHDPQYQMPRYDEDQETPELRESLIRWLQQAGVTHVLAMKPLNTSVWPVEGGRQIFDEFLNRSWGRGQSPLSLYELKGSRPRAFLEGDESGAGVSVHYEGTTAVELKVEAPQATRVVLLDLDYPGWTVTVDGIPARSVTFEGMYRSVSVPAGQHTIRWEFRVRWLQAGLGCSALALLMLAGWGWMSRQRPVAVESPEQVSTA